MLSRRTLLTAVPAGAAGLWLSSNRNALAQTPAAPRRLAVTSRVLEVKGRAATVFKLVGDDGKPGLSFLLGEHFSVQLHNET